MRTERRRFIGGITTFMVGLAAGGRAQDGAPGMMRVVVADAAGPRLASAPVPTAGPGQVRVRVHAAGVNPVDWKRAGPAGYRPGFDAAGVVDAVGTGVTAWRPGDPVIVFSDDPGAYADFIVVPAEYLARKPAAMSFAEAAGIPTVGFTAWNAIVDMGQVRPGMRVLVHGGSGGVGSAAVQIAKARGAYVLATASARNQAFLRELGVDEPIDYTAGPFERAARDVDVVLNTVDAETAARSVGLLKRGGLLVSVAGAVPTAACAAAGIRCSPRERGTPVGTVLREIAALYDQGRYRVHVEAEYPLERVADAWDRSRSGRTRGKIAITLR